MPLHTTAIGNISVFSNTSIEKVAGVQTKDNLIITGDVLLARNVERLMAMHGASYPFREMRIDTVDSFVLGNFEAAIPKKHVPTPNFHFAFSVATSSLSALHDFGFTHVSLANNHSYDFEKEGYENSKKVLMEEGIVPFGNQYATATSSVTFIQMGSTSVALIALHATVHEPTDEELKAVFSAASEADKQIVYIHWGTEYKPVHNTTQEQIAERLVAHGADLVVGHHPHVVQDVQVIDGVTVFYSLGNFLFDQYFDDAVQEGLVLSLSVIDNAFEIELIPVSSAGSLSSPYVMSVPEQYRFLSELSMKSDVLIADMIQSKKVFTKALHSVYELGR